MVFCMLKTHLLLFALLLCSSLAYGKDYFTPKTKQLIAATNPLIYNNEFVEAQKIISDYLEDTTLESKEEFYGYFLQAEITKTAGDPRLAISMLISANRLLADLKEEEQILYKAFVYGSIAECHFNTFEYEEAKKNALKSISFHPDNPLKSNGHAINYLIIGYAHRLDNAYKEATKYYRAAVKAYEANGNNCELPLCYNKIGNLYMAKKEYKLANYYMDKAIEIADSCKIDRYVLLSNLSKLTLLEEQKRYKEAFLLLKDIQNLDGALHKKNQLKLVADLQIKYQTALAQTENQKLKETAVIVQQNTTFKILLLSSFLVFSLALVLVSALLLRVRHQKNAKLEKQLEQINQQNKEREALLKEVHHRVKNNMQVITSLLHLEAANKTKNLKDATQLFQNSQNRINAMALVHETLYQSEDVSTIAIAPYIQDLIDSLYKELKQPQHHIEFELQIPDVHFGLDTAIPLGLLLNEILSNAFVHGFSEQTEGKIYIHIIPFLNNNYQLIVGDNGKGMEAFNIMLQKRSLGLSLIKKLVRQLQGSINTVETTKGCHYDINFQAVD